MFTYSQQFILDEETYGDNLHYVISYILSILKYKHFML